MRKRGKAREDEGMNERICERNSSIDDDGVGSCWSESFVITAELCLLCQNR